MDWELDGGQMERLRADNLPQNGGYINPPRIKRQFRDPHADWWDKQERRNYGEPVHEDHDILGMFSPYEYTWTTPGKGLMQIGAFIVTFFGVLSVVKMTYPDKVSYPREFEGGLLNELGGVGAMRVSSPVARGGHVVGDGNANDLRRPASLVTLIRRLGFREACTYFLCWLSRTKCMIQQDWPDRWHARVVSVMCVDQSGLKSQKARVVPTCSAVFSSLPGTQDCLAELFAWYRQT